VRTVRNLHVGDSDSGGWGWRRRDEADGGGRGDRWRSAMWSRLGFSGAAVARRFGDTSAYRSFGGWWLVWRRGGAVRQRWGRLGCGRWVGGGRGAGGRGGADDRRKKLRGGATQPEEEETVVEGKE
jgi:hypothetical protein